MRQIMSGIGFLISKLHHYALHTTHTTGFWRELLRFPLMPMWVLATGLRVLDPPLGSPINMSKKYTGERFGEGGELSCTILKLLNQAILSIFCFDFIIDKLGLSWAKLSSS